MTVGGDQSEKHTGVYTTEEVRTHTTMEDAWVTSRGRVYNITKFLDSHPGGYDVLVEHLGADIDTAMAETDHSPYAYNMLKEFEIGVVKGASLGEEAYACPGLSYRGFTQQQIHDAVDLHEAALPQVWSSGRKYWPWINSRPVCHTLTLFPQRALEAVTRWPWWYIWVLWPAVIAYLCVVSGDSAARLAPAVLAGAFIWTFVEYLLHRFVFHAEVSTKGGNLFHFFMHGIHHLTPTDSTRLTFPVFFSVPMAVGVFKLFGLLADATSLSQTGLFSGFGAMYVLYDTFHFFFHHSDFQMALFKRLRAAHLNHHYKNENMNFGVTSPLWDFVFGTYDGAYASHTKRTQ